MNILQKIITSIDRWQRQRPQTSFPYAVIKKYGEDEAGYQAALLTYYGFLSLFPLLLILTTLATIFGGQNEAFRETVVGGLTNYFPIFGEQLSGQIQGINKSGAPLVIGILFTLYGARGVADAFRLGVNNIWQIPRTQRDGFPLAMGKSLAIIIVGGGGFLVASISSGFAAAAGAGLPFRISALFINVFVLFWLFRFLINISLPKRTGATHTRAGALSAAVGLVFLQSIGGIILAQQLKSLDAVYSYFALALGLLFWLYLQAQVVYYAVEIASVRTLKLYPRGMSDADLTPADRRAYDRQAK